MGTSCRLLAALTIAFGIAVARGTPTGVEVYDVNLWDTSTATIDRLHAEGRRGICYFSAGSRENWRPDAQSFPPSTVGRPLDDWPGERWLDIRSPAVRSVKLERLDLAAEKGCKAVDPDNVDGYTARTGFPPADRS